MTIWLTPNYYLPFPYMVIMKIHRTVDAFGFQWSFSRCPRQFHNHPLVLEHTHFYHQSGLIINITSLFGHSLSLLRTQSGPGPNRWPNRHSHGSGGGAVILFKNEQYWYCSAALLPGVRLVWSLEESRKEFPCKSSWVLPISMRGDIMIQNHGKSNYGVKP